MSNLRKLWRLATQDGVRAVAEAVSFRIGVVLFGFDRFYNWRARVDDCLFDWLTGWDTSGNIPLAEMGVDSSKGRQYTAAPPWLVNRFFRKLPIDPSQYTFVDLGCGKGRVLMLAAREGFSRLVGVDLAPPMLEAAASNAAGLGVRVDLACVDAGTFTYPETPLVVFMFNPFWEDVVCQVAQKLEESFARAPRDIFVIYYRPRFRQIFDSLKAFHLIAEADLIHPWYAIYRSKQGDK